MSPGEMTLAVGVGLIVFACVLVVAYYVMETLRA